MQAPPLRRGAGGSGGPGSRAARPSIGLPVALGLAFAAGLLVRVVLWPTPGHYLDMDQFVRWVGAIATGGLARTYDQTVSFPPVIVYVWAFLGALDPAFRSAVDSSDATLRILMKVPASLADLGIALAVAYWYRDRPRAALFAAAVILFAPAIWYVSAWWGQYESIYVLPAVLAVLAARANRPGLVAVLLAVSLMAKPQALVFVVPFGAWLLGTQGWRGALKGAIVVGLTSIALWLPFIADGGPMSYLAHVSDYQNGVLSVASMNAWNPWWLVQSAQQGYLSDSTAILGPLTMRDVGLAAAGLLAVPVFVGVLRHPTAERLTLGLAAITLVAFSALTTMHERYAYAAIPFLLLACNRPAVRPVCAVLIVVVTLNLLLIKPPELEIPGMAQAGIIGPVILAAITGLAVAWTWRGAPGSSAEAGGAA